MGTLALIGLGSNLGDRKAILDAAVEQFRQTPELIVRSVSTYHETKPVGGPAGQGPFLNAAAALETTLEPIALFTGSRGSSPMRAESEPSAGASARSTSTCCSLVMKSSIPPELNVPHPRMGVRRFVLAPLEEIAAEVRDPLTGRSIRELRANLDRRPSYLAMEGWWTDSGKRPALEQLVAELNTGCWSQRDLEQNSRQWWARRLESAAVWAAGEDLEFLASSDMASFGDHWIVADFTLADLVASAPQNNGDRFPEQVRFARRPARGSGCSIWSNRRSSSKVRGRPSDCPELRRLLRSTPRLRLESVDPELQVSEILAACAATRT